MSFFFKVTNFYIYYIVLICMDNVDYVKLRKGGSGKKKVNEEV